MARFLGNASGRTIGAPTGAAGFTKAKVFASAGTTSFTVPQDVTKLKVFVVGAGSSYRTGTYAFCGDNCCSGVSYPKGCYCACFIGHLTGAGGGYAEKTFIQSTDFIAGKTLTINVGSIGGLSASSVSATGLTTVTASNATEAVYSWNCTSNSTARDNSNDNSISFGFCLPVCGYVNTFSGYYNKGGTSSGGDINRCGGNGTMIPQFLTDSYLDGIYCSTASGGASGNTSSCWRNPNIQCMCLFGYHYTFGSNCGASAWGPGCGCYYLCALISNLCYCEANSTNILSRYVYDGTCSSNKSSCSITGETSINGPSGIAFTTGSTINEQPIGLGAESGTSFGNGRVGESEQMAVYARGFTRGCGSTGAGSCCLNVTYQHYSQGYDFSFGGTQFSCYCANYFPGCYSNCTNFKGTQFGQTCYVCIGTTWTYVFGTNFSGGAHCWCMPFGNSQCSGTQLCDCRFKCIQVGFMNNVSSNRTIGYTIPLSTLVSDVNTNINDIGYGNGASATAPAGYGGGGNRLNPSGGGGLVVVVY